MRITMRLLIMMVSGWPAGTLFANVLENIRVHEAPDHTRVVFDATEVVKYTLTNDADKVVIVFASTKPGAQLDTEIVAAPRQRINALQGQVSGPDYQLTIVLKGRFEPKAFTLAPIAPYGHRLVLDLFAAGSGQKKPVEAPRTQGDRDVLIAIDPGHGGEDPGAIAANRQYEKNIVMQISRRVAAKIDALGGFKSLLVRDGDYYIALRDRFEFARKARADLFVSIHADAFTRGDVRGASVFTLSERGATSEMGRRLAQKENSSDLIGGVGEVSLKGKDPVLKSVLLDLSMEGNRSASVDAGKSVLSSLGRTTKLHKRYVEQAGFMVLKAPDIPSILVETGFLSNPAEARLLSQSAHQEKVATAIVQGIRSWIENSPPPGTLLAKRLAEDRSRARGTRYEVVRGDTLSRVASRFGISQRKLREANNLKSDTVRIGQVLVIPAS